MPEAATHKGRGAWKRWSGTPGLLARIACEAESQVLANDSGPGELRIRAVADAWESEFIDAGYFENGLAEGDIADIQSVEIYAFVSGRAISVTFARPPKPQQNQPAPPVGVLNVAGPDREWVKDATDAMKQAIDAGVPSGQRVPRWVMYGGLSVLAIGATFAIIGSKTDTEDLQTAGVVVLVCGIGAALLGGLSESLLPSLEILPEGKQTRRNKMLRWGRHEAAWWTRNVLLVLVGIGLTLLVQRLK
jgi:hypothetical protein